MPTCAATAALQDRVRIEAAALEAEAAHCPQHVPALYWFDPRMCIIAMQVRWAQWKRRRRCCRKTGPACPACWARSLAFFRQARATHTHTASPSVPACVPHPPACTAHLARPQYLAPPHIIVRKGLIEGRLYPRLASHLASFLAATLFHTSLLALPSDEFR